MDLKEFQRLPPWARGLLVVGMIAIVGVLRLDVIAGVEYKSARVLAIEPILDRPWDRFVTIQIDGKERVLRTNDRLIETTFGQTVCVQSNKRLIRGGRRYGLALPVYCRKDRLDQSKLAAAGEGAYL